MNKDAFLQQLGLLLQDIAPEEREEAIRFYNEYFDEAGEGEQAHILQELGSPERVAAIIKANVPAAQAAPTLTTDGINWQQQSEARQAAVQNANPDNIPLPAYARLAPMAPPAPSHTGQPGQQPGGYAQPIYSTSPLVLLIKIFLGICLLPAAFGVAVGLLGAFAALVVAGIALIAAGIGCIAAAGIVLYCNAAAAFAVTGTGLLLVALLLAAAALGIALIGVGVWFGFVVMPAAFRWLGNACKWVINLFASHKTGGAYA